MDPKWLEGFPKLSATLMEFGWFVGPNVRGYEFERLERLCLRLESVDRQDEKALVKAEEDIFLTLADTAYHPNDRIRYVEQGIRLNKFNAFSHLYESAIFSFYKRDYAGCILLLLSALEGVLLAVSGWKLGPEKQPGHKELIRIVRKSSPVDQEDDLVKQAHDMYRDVFANFLENWLYIHTRSANFDISVLNRHYVMHGLEPGNFYRPQDVHRMILAFDVLIEWLALNQGIYIDVFLDEEGPLIAKRMPYYHALAEGDQTIKQTWKMERELLKDHPRYQVPTVEFDYQQSQLIAMLDNLKLMSMARKSSEK